jgi:hypothetical protein
MTATRRIVPVAAFALVLVTATAMLFLRSEVALFGTHKSEHADFVDETPTQDCQSEASGDALWRRLEAKDRIAANVVARRLTLEEAVNRFRTLNVEIADIRARALRRHPYPEGTEEERLCREVIAWALNKFEKHPDEARALAAQLEKEMREFLAHQQRITESCEEIPVPKAVGD